MIALEDNRALPLLFNGLPVETQQAILASIRSREHLYSLSLASRHLNSLTAVYLFRDICFDPLDGDESVLSYLLHCGPHHGHLCRTLKLGYSLGPMVSRAADHLRSQLFIRILGHTKGGVRELEVDVAGTDLRNTLTLFTAIAQIHFPHLESLTFKIHDVEDDELDTLKSIVQALSDNAHTFPVLHTVTLEGYWEMHSHGRTAFIPAGLQTWLSKLKALDHLRLFYLTIKGKSLQALLSGVRLSHLSLHEIEPLSWQDCLQSIPQEMRTTLRWLSLSLSDTNISEQPIGLKLAFPNVGRLDISMLRYASSSTPLSLVPTYSTVFSHSRQVFPNLRVAGLGDAIQQLADFLPSVSLLLDAILANGVSTVVLDRMRRAPSVSETRALHEARVILRGRGIQLHSAVQGATEPDTEDDSNWHAYSTGKVVYINRDLRNGRGIDERYAAEANAAAEALAKAHGILPL